MRVCVCVCACVCVCVCVCVSNTILFICRLDVNECEDGTHDCHNNANCTNIPGSFNCSCKKGYTGNGSLCSGIIFCFILIEAVTIGLRLSTRAIDFF